MAGLKRREFFENEIVRAAVERKLEIICDSCSNLSKEIKRKILAIDWGDLRALRNEIAHDYRNIDTETIWSAATKSMPILEQELRKLL